MFHFGGIKPNAKLRMGAGHYCSECVHRSMQVRKYEAAIPSVLGNWFQSQRHPGFDSMLTAIPNQQSGKVGARGLGEIGQPFGIAARTGLDHSTRWSN